MSNFYTKYPVNGVPTFPTFAVLPVSASDGSLAVTLDTDTLYVFNANSLTWLPIGSPSAVLSIGTIDSQAPGANGATLNVDSIIMQSASASFPGLVNNTTQSFSGNKTFTGTIAASNLSGTNTGDVTLGTANGLSLAGQVLSLGLSSTSTTGALSSTDWNTFNGKQDALIFVAPLVNTAGSVAINGVVADNKLSFVNAADATKEFTFDLSGLSTAVTSILKPLATANVTYQIQPNVDATANIITQNGTSGQIFIGANASLGGANSGIQYSDATTANRGQIRLGSYVNATSIAGVTTATSRSGTVGVNAAVLAGQDYSKWTAQAGATTPGSLPISGNFAFKANTVNSLTVTSDYHLQLTNLAGTLGDRLYLTSEGLLQLPGYTTGVAQFDSTGHISSSSVSPGSLSLTNSHIFVGNVSNVAADVAMSGDATIANTGALTLATVNANVGSFTLSNITVNAKGLITAASSTSTGNLTDAGTDGITITNGTNAVIGSGTSIAQHVADTTHNGYLSSTDWNTFNSSSSQVFAGPTKHLYVESSYTGTATSDGSLLRPFVHIMDAINQINTNNDGLNYVVSVGPGTYSETISLNNAALTRLAIVAASNINGNQSNDAIPVTSIVGDINSTSNNDTLKALIMSGFDVQGNLILTGASNSTNFCQFGAMFSDMMFYTTGAPGIAITNAGQVILSNNGSAIQSGAGGVNIQNVSFLGIYSTFLNLGSISIVTNNGANKPTGFGGTGVQTSFGNRIGAVAVDAGSTLTQRFERVSGVLTSSGTIASINSVYQSAIILNAGTMSSIGDTFSSYPTISGGAFNPSGVDYYTAATSSNWNTLPTTINVGLDTLASSGIVKSQSANQVLASPNGSSGVPSFRALVAADIPALPYASNVLTNTHIFVGNASNVATDVPLSGDATLANTGALTLATVNANVGSFGSSTSIPSFTVNAKGLITAASGNVVIAPAGTLSGTTLNATVVSSSLTSVGTLTSGTWNATAIGPTFGGTGLVSYATGDLIYASASNVLSNRTIGSTGNVLTVSGGVPVWAAPATGGTVTSVSVVSANGLAGTVATATTTPAITLSTTITGILQGDGTAISAATTGNLTDVGTDGIVITGGTGAVLGSGTSIAQHVADTTHNGYLSSTDWNTFNGKQSATLTNTHIWVGNASNVATDVALSGDATLSNTGALTLATVNANTGSFGSSTAIPNFTVNAKGLITAAGTNVVIAPAGTLTGTTLAANVVSSSLTSVGTITSGTWNGTTIDVAHGGTSSTTLTAHAVLLGEGTSALGFATIGTSGRLLIDQGAAADPSFNAMSGDATITNTGALTFATVNANVGTFASVTVNAKGLVTAAAALSGDLTTSGSVATFATVNANVGSFTNANITVNAKGLITAAANGTGATSTAPTLQKFTSGSGTYTRPTSPTPLYIRVRMVGGGGGGGGSGGTAGTAATDGGNSTFGTSLLTANGGGHAVFGGGGGSGGTASLGSGPIGTALTGGSGTGAGADGAVNTDSMEGSPGAASPFGGEGGGGAFNTAGSAAAANTGSGGGGAGGPTSPTNAFNGSSGGASGFVDAIITSPASTYSYAVGAAGSGGAAGTSPTGTAGGNGGSGYIEVVEFYQ